MMASAEKLDLLKAHIDQYTRKDGTVVQAHEDKRVAKVGDKVMYQGHEHNVTAVHPSSPHVKLTPSNGAIPKNKDWVHTGNLDDPAPAAKPAAPAANPADEASKHANETSKKAESGEASHHDAMMAHGKAAQAHQEALNAAAERFDASHKAMDSDAVDHHHEAAKFHMAGVMTHKAKASKPDESKIGKNAHKLIDPGFAATMGSGQRALSGFKDKK